MSFWEVQASNVRKTFLVIVLYLILLALLGFSLDGYLLESHFPIMTFFALFFGIFQSFAVYYSGEKMILASLHARPADPSDFKEQQLLHVVQEMAIASGLPPPRVYVIPEMSPNAFASGRDENHSVIAVTEGLLDVLNREELQGVIGHEMAHIRNRDILLMMFIAALVGAINLLSDWSRRTVYYGGGAKSGSSRRGGKASGGGLFAALILLLIILAPILSRLMALFVSRAREYLADSGSAEFTRNPLALASALEKIATHPDKRVDRATYSTAHLFISDPLRTSLNERESWFAELWSTHPPLAKRIRLLREMAYVQTTTYDKNA
ncbi:MAG: M48 family metallopeptidase [bacterium JZ-2024 1]